MKKARFTEEQMVAILREADKTPVRIEELSRAAGLLLVLAGLYLLAGGTPGFRA